MMLKKNLKTALSVILVFTMIFTMTACGGGDGSSSSFKTPENELVIGTYSNGSTCRLDPSMTSNYGDWQYNNQMYDTIVTSDFDGVTIKDALAESWDVSEDGKTYTFHLKDGIKFHSGKALTSADVKASWERWRTDAEAQYSYYLDFVDTIETPDDQTVVLNLSQPDNNLLINLTVPVAAITNVDAVEQAEAEGKVYGVEVVDGTGPFKLGEFVTGDHITMVRNDDYTWGSSIYENQGPAHLEKLTVKFLTEPSTRLMEFKSGNVDILGNGCVFAQELDRILEDKSNTVVEYVPPYPVFIMFQTERVPDVQVRKAMNMAIDRDEIVATTMGGHSQPMVGALPSDYKWYWDGADDMYPYDLDAAGKILDEAGYTLESDGYRYKDGKKLSIEISYCASDEDAKTAELVQAQMKKIGIDIQINTNTADFFTRIGGEQDNNFDILIMGLYINSPEDMLQEYLYSKNIPAPNRSKWSDPQVDKLLVEARSTTDEGRRQECYDEIQKIAMEEALWIPLYNKNGWSVMKSYVKGYKAHPTIVEGEPKYLDVYKEAAE